MNSQIVSAKPLRTKSALVSSYPWKTSVLDEADLPTSLKDELFQVITQIYRLLSQNLDTVK
jgi:hypothetical protein